jgi:signal transduction histidine kinase
MTEETERITPEDLGRRLPLPGTGDEVEQLAGSFNGLLTRVQEAYERQRRFTGDASHQLRTPLTVMLGQVEVALRRDRSKEDYVRTLDIVRRRIIDLQQITEMLLFLARADAETQISESATVDAWELLSEAVERWQSHARRGDLNLSPQREKGDSAPLWVRVHRPLFAQLLDNLIDNALKYSAAGSPVLLRAERGAGGIRIMVKDQGPGIPADEAPQLFAPFFRGREARTNGRQGVGLGLAVAQRIAAALGGTITVEPSTTTGACFIITLPPATNSPGSSRGNEETATDEKVSPACAQ